MSHPLLFVGSSASHLSLSLQNLTHLPLARYRLGRFADNEILFFLEEPVQDAVCVIVLSTHSPAENLLEAFTIVNTLKINGAQKIILVTPYFGYARSDRPLPNQPINARLFLSFLTQAGVDQFITLNLHSDLVESYFPKPNLHLSFMPSFAQQIEALGLKNFSVATPDKGGTQRARDFAQFLNLSDIVVVEKHRPTTDTTEVTHITGNIKGQNIVLVDDMIQTGHTLLNAGQTLKNQGAADLYVCATHPVYSAEGIKLLTSTSLFKHLFVTNSISKNILLPTSVTVLDISPLLASAITSLL